MKTNIIKGKKQLRAYDIPVDVYDREVYLYIGQTMEDACFGAKSEFEDLDLDHEDLSNLAMAITITKSGYSAHLILMGMDSVKTHDLLGILAHECLHTSWHILERVGVQLDAINHEAQAYLLEHIFKNCKDALKHYIKTYKLKHKL